MPPLRREIPRAGHVNPTFTHWRDRKAPGSSRRWRRETPPKGLKDECAHNRPSFNLSSKWAATWQYTQSLLHVGDQCRLNCLEQKTSGRGYRFARLNGVKPPERVDSRDCEGSYTKRKYQLCVARSTSKYQSVPLLPPPVYLELAERERERPDLASSDRFPYYQSGRLAKARSF